MAQPKVIANTLTRFYPQLHWAAKKLEAASTASNWFEPAWSLPELTPELEEFFSATDIAFYDLGEYRGHQLYLQDLTQNPGTHTTKTFGSSSIVARAVKHTQVTGEPIVLVTPSAANKAVALRNAVLRAYRSGLSDPERLRVVTVVPQSSQPKLWASELDSDPELRRINPIGAYSGAEREHVKKITTAAIDQLSTGGAAVNGFRIWYTLNPNNYRLADLVRTLAEYALIPPAGERWHTHAVSSAYGFLGHDLGRQYVEENGAGQDVPQKYLLVQHLETPDLVSAVTGLDVAQVVNDSFSFSPEIGMFVRPDGADLRLPGFCYGPQERLERTFYTRNPPTTDAVVDVLRRRGGTGMVVSLPEALQAYPFVRSLFSQGGFDRLPEDPRWLREWAMVMASVGGLNAIDRGIIPSNADVVIHGSGAYSEGEFQQLDRSRLIDVDSAEDVKNMVVAATASKVLV